MYPVIFLFAEVSEEISSVPLRVESINQSCRELAAQDRNSPPLPSEDDESTLKQVTVKQEKTDEEGDDSACCLDSIKVEDFSPEEEGWMPEVLDLQSQASNTPLSCTRLAQGKKDNNEFLKQWGLAVQTGDILVIMLIIFLETAFHFTMNVLFYFLEYLK